LARKRLLKFSSKEHAIYHLIKHHLRDFNVLKDISSQQFEHEMNAYYVVRLLYYVGDENGQGIRVYGEGMFVVIVFRFDVKSDFVRKWNCLGDNF
jgi:hypothetical protein